MGFFLIFLVGDNFDVLFRKEAIQNRKRIIEGESKDIDDDNDRKI